MAYALDRTLYDTILDVMDNDKAKADKYARVIEVVVDGIREEAKREILDTKLLSKVEIKEDLKTELATNENLLLTEHRLQAQMAAIEQRLEAKIHDIEHSLEAKIHALELKITEISNEVKVLKAYLRFLIVLVIIGMTLMNPNLAEVIRLFLR